MSLFYSRWYTFIVLHFRFLLVCLPKTGKLSPVSLSLFRTDSPARSFLQRAGRSGWNPDRQWGGPERQDRRRWDSFWDEGRSWSWSHHSLLPFHLLFSQRWYWMALRWLLEAAGSPGIVYLFSLLRWLLFVLSIILPFSLFIYLTIYYFILLNFDDKYVSVLSLSYIGIGWR